MRPRTLALAGLTLALGVAVAPHAGADPTTPSPPGDKASTIGKEKRAEAAQAALDRAEELFAGGHRDLKGADAHAHGRSATLVLRDLGVLLDELPPQDRARAAELVARPTANRKACTGDLCVHWTTVGDDAPNLADGDGDDIPNYVEKMLSTVQGVHDDYVAAGYRAPLPDGTHGGDARTDIYIANLGSDNGLYGYCTSDWEDPASQPQPPVFQAWAYCALDDDYSPTQYPTNTPIENMQVTAAHEYFHAVQYAYDAFEDSWIMEATATWVEDEMYDAVNDSWQYLSAGPMGRPWLPLDTSGSGYKYGAWVFFRYLTERLSAEQGGLPVLVRDMWRRMDADADGPDQYSAQAVKAVLAARGAALPRELSLFADANRHPAGAYEEGGSYPAAPLTATVNVGRTSRDPAVFSRRVDHLASATVAYVPTSLSESDWRLALQLDLANTSRGSAAVITVHRRDGSVSTSQVTLDSNGNARKVVGFSSNTVRRVEVTLVNGGSRFDCWQDPPGPHSCAGTSLDDDIQEKVDPKAFRS